MNWIKRNLFFAIGLVMAIALLGVAGFYDFQSWQRNNKAFADLTEIYSQIRTANNAPHSPSNDNIQAARKQESQLREWIKQTRDYFQPIEPIPAHGPLTSETYAPALLGTIRQLTSEADSADVKLPPQYFFSFTAESDKAVFDPGSLGALAQQLGEVKTIAEIIFGARVNELEGIQRVPVSPDDMTGQQADYITDLPITNSLAILTPYQVTFLGFSSDIANVLAAFATSPHAFIVQGISVQPAAAAENNGGQMPYPGYQMGGPGRQMGGPGRQMGGPGYQEQRYGNVPNYDGQMPPRAMPMTERGGLQTVLNEQLLRVTMEIEVVKLTSNR